MDSRPDSGRAAARLAVPVALATLLALVLLVPSARGDRVITSDGRIITPQKAREVPEGYRLTFEHGEVLITDTSVIEEIEIEGDMSDYEPESDDEREKLEDGFVRYRGRWLSKPAYKAQLDREFQASKKRLDELAAHNDFGNPWEKETKHFLIKTNTSPELLEYYAELLETYYGIMDKRVGISPTPTYRRKKMTVKIYKSMEEFLEWSEEFGVSYGVLGFFTSYDDSLNFYHDYAEPARTDWVALHECTHLLTFLIDQQFHPQIWLNEAVADYFGSAEITRDKRGKLKIEPGKLQIDRILTVQEAFKEGNHVPLKKLFFIKRSNFHGFEYAHAWSFVYFLNNYKNGKYQKGFNRFFKGLYTLEKGIEYSSVPGPPPTGTWKEVSPQGIQDYMLKRLGTQDLAKMEVEWRRFIEGHELDAPRARLKRGLRAMGEFEFKEALEDLDAAIEAGLEDPQAYAARGMARAFSGKKSEAEADLRKAIELDPLNAAYRYQLSSVLSGHMVAGLAMGGIRVRVEGGDALKNLDPETKAEARAMAGLAMDLDPQNDGYRDWYHRFE